MTSTGKAISLAIVAAVLILSATSTHALPTTQPGPDAAQLIGFPGYPANDLYEVRFVMIDDENVGGNRNVLWIEPGRYVITVSAIVRNPPGLRSRNPQLRSDPETNRIEIVAEAGKSYQILQKFVDDSGRNRYTTVLHRVYETP